MKGRIPGDFGLLLKEPERSSSGYGHESLCNHPLGGESRSPKR
jgi:hypothetical protein